MLSVRESAFGVQETARKHYKPELSDFLCTPIAPDGTVSTLGLRSNLFASEIAAPFGLAMTTDDSSLLTPYCLLSPSPEVDEELPIALGPQER